jgi:hypothetical protein
MSCSRLSPIRSVLTGTLLLTTLLAACDKPPVPVSTADSARPKTAQRAPATLSVAGQWKAIGRTERGTSVLVDSASIRDSASLRIATFRIDHQTPYPKDTAQVPIRMTLALLVAECGNPPHTVARDVQHFADTDGAKIISTHVDDRAPWNVESPGTFGDVSVGYLCTGNFAGEKPAAPPAKK